MRTLILALAAALPTTAMAQEHSTLYARLGATWSSPLVEDLIVSDRITTQPGIAATIVLGGATEVFPRYDGVIEVQFTRGSYEAETTGQGTTDLGTLSTLSALLGLNGPLVEPYTRWQANIGVLKYLPAEDTGIFLQGGPLDFLVGLGADYRRQVSSSIDVSVALRYDYHRFTTDELRRQGFSQTQAVHRVGLTVGIALGGRR